MPIDEFICTQCRGVFVRMDPPGAPTCGICPACQGLAWRRLRIHCRAWQAPKPQLAPQNRRQKK